MCERRQGAIFLRKAGVPVTSRYFSLLCCLGNLEAYTGVSKNRGKTPKMDGLFHGKPYEQMDDLGGKNPYFWKHPYNVFSLALFVSCQWAQLMHFFWFASCYLGDAFRCELASQSWGKLTPDTLLSSIFRLQVWKMITSLSRNINTAKQFLCFS